MELGTLQICIHSSSKVVASLNVSGGWSTLDTSIATAVRQEAFYKASDAWENSGGGLMAIQGARVGGRTDALESSDVGVAILNIWWVGARCEFHGLRVVSYLDVINTILRC